MNLVKRNLYISFLLLIFLLSIIADWYFILSILLLMATIATIVDKLGKGIVLRELIVLHAIFVALVMPVLGYSVYNEENHLARAFVKYMQVPKDQYFGFVLPAVSLFALMLCWPIRKDKYIMDEGIWFQQMLKEIKTRLAINAGVGIYLLIIGIIMFYVARYVPVGLRFFSSLFFSACFAGILYIFYSPSFRYKKIVFLAFLLFLIWNSIESGVFTIVAYMGITIFSFFFIGRKQKFWKKILISLICVFVLLVIQAVKSGFRDATWKSDYEGSKASLFLHLVTDKVTHVDQLINKDALFPFFTRANQGYNISLVMRRIPAVKDFDRGSRLAVTAFSSLVPRILWPDKPEAGGQESMLYFAGAHIVGWSTNVSPIGEAYGSFGVTGGIIFMGLLGMFIRWSYKRVFIVARKMPLIVLWIPVLFFQVTYSMETDTMQILNSLIKSAFFIWLLYKVVPGLLKPVEKFFFKGRIIKHPNLPA